MDKKILFIYILFILFLLNVGYSAGSCSISVSPANPQINERISITVTYSNLDSSSKYFRIDCGNGQATTVGPCTGTSGSCTASNQCSYSTSGTYTVRGSLIGSPYTSCSPATVTVGGGGGGSRGAPSVTYLDVSHYPQNPTTNDKISIRVSYRLDREWQNLGIRIYVDEKLVSSSSGYSSGSGGGGQDNLGPYSAGTHTYYAELWDYTTSPVKLLRKSDVKSFTVGSGGTTCPAPTCTASQSGTLRCDPNNNRIVQMCGWDSTYNCYRWGTWQTCSSNQICSNGQCVSSGGTNTPPSIIGRVGYSGTTRPGDTITFHCDASDPDQDKSTLSVRIWIGRCISGTCSSADNFKPWVVSETLMSYRNNRFEYTWTIPTSYSSGDRIGATCQATDNQGAKSGWGDSFPLFTVSSSETATCSISVSKTNPQINEAIGITVTYTNMDSSSKYFRIDCGNGQATTVGPCTGTSGSCTASNQCSYSTSGTYTVRGSLIGSPYTSCSPATVTVGGGGTNSAPSLTITAPSTARLGDTIRISLVASDPDGDSDIKNCGFTLRDPSGNQVFSGYAEITYCTGSGQRWDVFLESRYGSGTYTLDAFVNDKRGGATNRRLYIYVSNGGGGTCIDNDRDGYGAPGSVGCPRSGVDCNDNDPSINPGALENCNDGIDNDCDGSCDRTTSTCIDGSRPGDDNCRLENACPFNSNSCTNRETTVACLNEWSRGNRNTDFISRCINVFTGGQICRNVYRGNENIIQRYDSNNNGIIEPDELNRAINDWRSTGSPNDAQLLSIASFWQKNCNWKTGLKLNSFTCEEKELGQRCSFSAENIRNENVVVLFLVVDKRGRVVSAPIQTISQGIDTKYFDVFYSVIDPGEYEIVWRVYSSNDFRFSNPITWSKEGETQIFVYRT